MEELLRYIEEDDALKATISSVFARLPEPARHDLKNVIWDIQASSRQDRLLTVSGAAGHTSCEDKQYPESLRYRISLRRNLPSEAARTCVVAHELAHAYLRHPTLLVRLNLVYKDIMTWEQLVRVIEDQADLQMCFWGFQNELLALPNDFPEARRPTFVDLLPEWKFL